MSDDLPIEIQSFQYAFCMVPSVILYDPDLDSDAKCVYQNMLHRSMNEEKVSFPSIARIASDLNLSPNYVRKQIHLLEGFGLISRQQRFDPETKVFGSNLYTIISPAKVYGHELVKKAYPRPSEIIAVVEKERASFKAKFAADKEKRKKEHPPTPQHEVGTSHDAVPPTPQHEVGVPHSVHSKYKNSESEESESEEKKNNPQIVKITTGVIGCVTYYQEDGHRAIKIGWFFNGEWWSESLMKEEESLLECYERNKPLFRPKNLREIKPKRAKETLPPSSNELSLAKKWLALAVKFTKGKPYPSWSETKFAAEIAKIKTRTGYDDKEMEAIFTFVENNDFWTKNALSPAALLNIMPNKMRKIDNIRSAMKGANNDYVKRFPQRERMGEQGYSDWDEDLLARMQAVPNANG